jgi:hypothetical protein
MCIQSQRDPKTESATERHNQQPRDRISNRETESATERHNQQPRDRISNRETELISNREIESATERQNQQPRDRIIGHNKFLGVEPGGGPENQDDKMVRGVHLVEILILHAIKMLDVECQT